MQNKPNSRKQFWKDNGYYILLGLCVAAVGVSGYFFVTGALQEKEQTQEVLSIPATVEEPEKQESQTQSPAEQTAPTHDTVIEQNPVESVMAQTPEVVLPVSGEVLQDHAMDRLVYQPTTKDWRVHNGVDLAAEPGQEVKAARAGTVASIYADDYYGTTVVLQHDDGYTSRYCNLMENVQVAVGDTVAAGQPIGMVGATALIESASESHLHFEVYQGSEPVDPASFLY